MGIYVNPGNEEFENIVNSEIYVDKTDLLQYTNSAINTEQRYLCMSRPRRFGKSITANMLAAYYSKACDSGKLFAPYKIAQIANCEKYRNKYGVIHVDMNVFRHRRKAGSNETVTACETVGVFQEEVIAELRKEYPDCIAEKECDLPNALINIHMQTGEKFVIIIDEWDTIFREDKEDEKAQKLYITLLRGLFKDNNARKFVALGYITGILPIKKYGTESALNNFDEFNMLCSEPLGEYIGFTEQEILDLYSFYGMDVEEAKSWYDGYIVGDGIHIYNPKAVVDSIRRRKFANYWTKTETYDSLKNYISMNFDGLKDSIINMLTGARVKVDTNMFENDMTGFKNRDDILTVLIHLGYLAYDATKQEVYIPNEEIRSAFSIAIKNSKWKYTVEAIEASDLLLKATWEQNETEVATRVNEVHQNNTSILKYNDENSLACVITLAYYNAINEYTLIRELPTGKGYADMVFLPRRHSDKPALLVELKYNQSVESAIDQMKKKNYTNALKEYKGNLLLVGIHYDKETKEHMCRIETMEMT